MYRMCVWSRGKKFALHAAAAAATVASCCCTSRCRHCRVLLLLLLLHAGLSPAPGANRPEGVHPKGSWKAHEGGAPITALSASVVGGARVVTGFRDGSICM